MEIQDEKKRLGLENKQIGVNMGKTESEIERYYNLITLIDNCLEQDHKTPGDYSVIKSQEQLWKNTIERAEKNKNKGEKDLIYKIARMISVNSGKFGDRDYKIASALQKKNNLKQVLDHLTNRYSSIKVNKKKEKDENDPLRGLRRVTASNAIDPSIVNQIPVKAEQRQIDILLGAVEILEQHGNDKAALNYSEAGLLKIETMNSLKFPEQYKKQIRNNLNSIIKKAERLIKEKKL
tara:strand:- start:46 stop:753 length:708 start_codon:yes stop_codon:yes gene_type:complete